jgi:putative NADH-flavin reductase
MLQCSSIRKKVFLDRLREANDLDWTMLSPSAWFTAGERSGQFAWAPQLLTGFDGKSWISYEISQSRSWTK